MLIQELPNGEVNVKLIDFGLSNNSGTIFSKDQVGTLIFSAPEVNNTKNYTSQVDIWAVGLIQYMMFSM